MDVDVTLLLGSKFNYLSFLGIGLSSLPTERYDVETTNKHNNNNDREKRTENATLDESTVEQDDYNEERNVEDAVSVKKSKHASVKAKHHHSKSGSKRHKKGSRFTC